jgi:hypothetical protein
VYASICPDYEPEIVIAEMTQKRYKRSSLVNKSTKAKSKSGNGEKKAIQTRHSRAKYACKPELQRVFDFVNLVPPDCEMKDAKELKLEDRVSFRMGTPGWNKCQIGNAGIFISYIKTFPQELIAGVFALEKLQTIYDTYQESNRIFEQTSDPEAKALRDKIEPMLLRAFEIEEQRYWSLRSTRKTMYRLAEIGENPEPYLGKTLEDVVIGIPLLVEYAYLDKDGKLHRSLNRFAEALEGVEVSRIRACLICRRLFWANRKDKQCCSEEHSRIIRQRQVRENQKLNKGVYGRAAKRRNTIENEHHEDTIESAEKDNAKQ